MKTIVVPIDFSSVTRRQLDMVNDLVDRDGGHVLILHVLNPSPNYMGYGTFGDLAGLSEAEQQQRLEVMVDDLKAHITHEGVKVAALLEHGEPVPKILYEVQRIDADCLVLGSHGHGNLYDLLVGSTSEAVMRKAPCAVLVVPSPQP